MRTFLLALGAAAMAVPISAPLPVVGAAQADAKTKRYKSRAYYRSCRYSHGTTGLIAGGATGAVVGSKVIGGGIVGTAAGAVGGAFAGRAIDRTISAKKRCRNYRR
ncbi:MAG: hypothetical protein ACKOOL_13890 [Novosphingobium sp.]